MMDVFKFGFRLGLMEKQADEGEGGRPRVRPAVRVPKPGSKPGPKPVDYFKKWYERQSERAVLLRHIPKPVQAALRRTANTLLGRARKAGTRTVLDPRAWRRGGSAFVPGSIFRPSSIVFSPTSKATFKDAVEADPGAFIHEYLHSTDPDRLRRSMFIKGKYQELKNLGRIETPTVLGEVRAVIDALAEQPGWSQSTAAAAVANMLHRPEIVGGAKYIPHVTDPKYHVKLYPFYDRFKEYPDELSMLDRIMKAFGARSKGAGSKADIPEYKRFRALQVEKPIFSHYHPKWSTRLISEGQEKERNRVMKDLKEEVKNLIPGF